MRAPAKVQHLVGLFHRNADDHHSPQYNEARLRQEFVNPLFNVALGTWTTNRASAFLRKFVPRDDADE
jgi:hypothetical protein